MLPACPPPSSHLPATRGTQQKSKPSSRPAGYIRRLALAPLPARRPPLRRLPHHHNPPPRPASAPAPAWGPARRRRPRKRGRGSAEDATRRHGGGRFLNLGPAGAAMSPPCPGDPSAPDPGAPVPRRPRRPPRPSAGRRCSPWWRMAVDSPRQIRARRVAPRMAATTAEENVDVNTRPFIGRSRLGGSSDRTAGAGRQGTPRAGAGRRPSG